MYSVSRKSKPPKDFAIPWVKLHRIKCNLWQKRSWSYCLQSCLEGLVLVENHLRGCYRNHSIIAKEHALVYQATSTVEFLMVFISPRNATYAPLVYCLVNRQPGLPSVAASAPCHILATCMLLHAAPSLVLNCVKVWTNWRPQIQWNEVWCFLTQKLDCWTCMTPAHWPASNLFIHNLCKALL